MLKKKYQRPIYTHVRPIQVEDMPKNRDKCGCVWCGAVLKKDKQFCSRECERNFLTRARLDELRHALQERDVSICEECGNRDPHYVVYSPYAEEKGSGAAGVDWVKTLCEQCRLDRKGKLTDDDVENPKIPDTAALRRRWRSIKRRWKTYRYTLGPLFLSARRWAEAHQDYLDGKYDMAKLCAWRNRDHMRQLTITIRWWKILYRRHTSPHEILTFTLNSLQEQINACHAWQVYWRERGIGALD